MTKNVCTKINHWLNFFTTSDFFFLICDLCYAGLIYGTEYGWTAEAETRGGGGELHTCSHKAEASRLPLPSVPLAGNRF